MEWPKYRSAGHVDNQIGHVHNNLRCVIPKGHGFNVTQYDATHPNVFIVKDAVSRELAERVRKFVQEIPFDSMKPVMNDIDNLPKEDVYKAFLDPNRIVDAYHNRKDDPKGWNWERYAVDFWRAAPLSAEAFCGSPLIELIDVLEERWRATDMTKLWGSSLTPSKTEASPFPVGHFTKLTWVVQKMEPGYTMGFHNDEFDYRLIAFIYYLTPDDWDYRRDGGQLVVCRNDNRNDYLSINPEFNTMVWWDMHVQKSPLHSVSAVTCTDKARIALVGFLGIIN